MPARISVVFCPVVAVTLPVTDPAATCAAGPRCCAEPGLAQIKMANSNAPQSGYHAPSLPLRHNFNDSLHDRTGHDHVSNLGLTSRGMGSGASGQAKQIILLPSFIPSGRRDQESIESSERSGGRNQFQ